MTRFRIAIVVIILVGSVSCKKKPSPILVDAAPPPSLGTRAVKSTAFEMDELWKRAMQSDPLDLGLLADREGAAGLLGGIEQGGDIASTALKAVPYADDAELALQRLAEIALQTSGADQLAVVDAIELIVAKPLNQREVLDVEGSRYCVQALHEIARNSSLKKETRSRAISALRHFAERLVVDPRPIPTDLDER